MGDRSYFFIHSVKTVHNTKVQSPNSVLLPIPSDIVTLSVRDYPVIVLLLPNCPLRLKLLKKTQLVSRLPC